MTGVFLSDQNLLVPSTNNAEIRALIAKRDITYNRWKRFRMNDLKAIHKSAHIEVTRYIKIAKILFYGGNFS